MIILPACPDSEDAASRVAGRLKWTPTGVTHDSSIVISLWGWLLAVLNAISRALALDPSLLAKASHPGFLPVAGGVALLAGASTMLGHSVVLFLNRVRGLRFVLALLGAGLWTVFFFLVQGALVGVVGHLALGRGPDWLTLFAVVMLSAAPLCFNFLILIPYSGLFIGRLLQMWSFFILVVAISPLFKVSLWGSLLITSAGWLIRHLLAQLAAGPVSWVSARGWRVLTGRPTLITPRDVLAGSPFVNLVGDDS